MTYIFEVEMYFHKETMAVNFVHRYYDYTTFKLEKYNKDKKLKWSTNQFYNVK